MGLNLKKRLDDLEKQVDGTDEGRLGFLRSLIISLILLNLLIAILPEVTPSVVDPVPHETQSPAKKSTKDLDKDTARLLERLSIANQAGNEEAEEEAAEDSDAAVWQKHAIYQANSRKEWLEMVPFRSTAAQDYFESAAAMIDRAASTGDGIGDAFIRRYTSGKLTLWFLIVGFWPFWVIALGLGYAYFRVSKAKQTKNDVLGVCDPGTSPFYSGFYAPLAPNHGPSGTDSYAPNLACPERANAPVVVKHKLGQLLRKYNALSETTIALAGVVIAYADFPAIVEDERSNDEHTDSADIPSEEQVVHAAGVIPPPEVLLAPSCEQGLQAVLEAHRALVRFFRSHGAEEIVNEQYEQYLQVMNKISSQLSPLAAVLVTSLTPLRARAMSLQPVSLPAAAYLAAEAGKSLVFKRIQGGFAQISRFPHLQARAVLQSIAEYYKDFNPEQRLCVRQAIVCSRRHGDFGRAFLPHNMSLGSSAIRDWLEILYEADEDRPETGQLVELTGHIAEIKVTWQRSFVDQFLLEQNEELQNKSSRPGVLNLSQGIPYHSVLLMPLNKVVEMSFSKGNKALIERIMNLLEMTRQRQARLSISARLPGFSRQAVEASKGGIDSGGVTKLLAENPSGEELVSKWLIVRRMLTRYNWLSTRIGDDAVPIDGLVQAVVISHDGDSSQAIGLDALVPVRTRRLKELLGEDWDRRHYFDSPHPDNIKVYIENEEFVQGLKSTSAKLVVGGSNQGKDSANAV